MPGFTPAAPGGDGPRDNGTGGQRGPRGGSGEFGRPSSTGGGPAAPWPRPAGFGGGRADGPLAGPGGPQPGPLRWIGALSVKGALLVMAGAMLVGVLLTLLAGHEPGLLLGICVIAGSAAAAFGIRRNAVYLLFPLPVLAFFVGALLSGLVHDSQLASSTAGLGASFLQWVAGIFFPMVVATILVLLIGGGRWLFGSQLVTGRAPLPAGLAAAPGSARSAPGLRRPAPGDQWAADDPFAPRNPGTGPTPRPGTARPGTGPGPVTGPGPGGSRPPRSSRDQRTDRDPWGDPRLPADRQPPTGPRPRPTGPASQPQPRERTQRTGPSWSPPPGPPRPSRPQPPEGWDPR